jgi:hypothetical protein
MLDGYHTYGMPSMVSNSSMNLNRYGISMKKKPEKQL